MNPPDEPRHTREHEEFLRARTRRQFFHDCGLGVGALALHSLTRQGESRPERPVNPMASRPPHFAPKAKRIIYLFMNGAPSQPDLLDYKPKHKELDGQSIPDSFTKGERFAFIRGTPKILGSPYKFERHGDLWISELLPNLPSILPDIAVVKSMTTDQFNHAPAELFLNTGLARVGRPSMGSWLTYGLGTENQDLPGFVVLLSGGGQPSGGCSCWSSGFLPTVHQGVQMRSGPAPVLFVKDPPGMDSLTRRQSLDALRDLNGIARQVNGDPEVDTRIAAYELAFRMQTSVPELADLSQESEATLGLYGAERGTASFASNCLLARRLVERGVRFVQLYHRGWDSHGTGTGDDLLHSLPQQCKDTDRAAVALVKDLKQRGLLESTLVVWGGEFGRTPMNEARNGSTFLGRDHHPHAFTMWLAGGGVKAGLVMGETDELGYKVVKDPVHVHDLQATILHLFGLDHTKLTHRHQGRDFRLTDVHGNVVRKLLA